MVKSREERYRAVCDLFPELRVELIGGRVVVNDVGTWQHNTVISRLLFQIVDIAADHGWAIWPNITVFLESQADRYVPDLTVVPPDPLLEGDDAVHGSSTLLLVDVVAAGSAYDDHVIKPKSYALAGAPLYLVIDPFQQRVKLHSEPRDKGYAGETTVSAGKTLAMPYPWDCVLDTGRLLGS
jgi:Uma2 family endonuclease